MRDYDREWFTLEGREIETLVAECRKDPSADIWVIFRRGDQEANRPPARRWLGFSTAHNPNKRKRPPAGGAISLQDRRSGRTLRGSFCSALAALGDEGEWCEERA